VEVLASHEVVLIGIVAHGLLAGGMHLTEAIFARRAVRSYQPLAVDERTIERLLDAAVQAPSAMNSQSWGFAIVQDRVRLRRYSDVAKSLLLEGTAHDPKISRYSRLLASEDFNVFYDASTLIVICATARSHYAEADCWLAAQNLMLEACEIGLGSCPIGFAVAALNTPAIKRELAIPENGVAVAPIIVGYATAEVPAVPRSAPRVLSWDVRVKASES
jgi:nitroreductase